MKNSFHTAAVLAILFLFAAGAPSRAEQAVVTLPGDTQSKPDACQQKRSFNTPEDYEEFLRACPSAPERQQMLEAMAGLIGKRKDAYDGYKRFSSEFPDGMPLVPYQYQLLLIGPQGLRVRDCVERIKKGEETSIILEEVRKRGGLYKDFTLGEIDTLKQMGLTVDIVQAMIDSTWDARKRSAAHGGQQDYTPSQTAAESGAATYYTTGQQGSYQPVSDAVVNCASQLAAKRACERLSGSFARSLCNATAESQFPCR